MFVWWLALFYKNSLLKGFIMIYVPKMVVQASMLVLFLDKMRQTFISASICANYLGSGTTFHYALKLLQPMGTGHVLSTRNGRNGGYKLVRSMEDITLAEIWGCFPSQRLKIEDLGESGKIMRLVEREFRQVVEVALGGLTMAVFREEIKQLTTSVEEVFV